MNKTLGPVSAKLINTLYERNRTTFTLKDAQEITNLKAISLRKLLHDLIKRRVITRLKSGRYVIIPQEVGNLDQYIGNWYIAAKKLTKSQDYYISYYSAMSLHDMTSHPVTRVYISTPLQEYSKLRHVGGVTFEFIFMSKKQIWAIENHWVTNSEKVRVSDIERTIIDCLYKPKYAGGILEVAKGIWMQKEQIDLNKLIEYSIKFNKKIVIKRIGFVLESLGLLSDNRSVYLQSKINNRYYKLDPLIPTDKTYKNSWKLIVNISPDEIKKAVGT